jgi:hypothetical protein
MTIAVYRINPQTGVRTQVRGRRTVEPATTPDLTSGYPPCACPRCTGKGGRGRLRSLVTEVNWRSRGAL